ncbi:MAG: hypothetical protein ACK56I_05990, partial [bacterium]
HVVVHQALIVAVLDRSQALDVLHQVFDEQVLVSEPGVQPDPGILHGVRGLDLDGQLLRQTHLSELLEQLPRRCTAVVGHLEGLELPLERRVVSEGAVEVRPARVPPGPA